MGGVILLIAAAGLTGWLYWRHLDGRSLAHARQAGAIRIGYAVEAPYSFLTSEGTVTGESPEIARAIAAKLGIPRVEWRLAEFGGLIDGLEARQFEVIAAGMFITPERQRRVDFSLPTFQVGPGLLVRKGNPLALHSYADILQRTNARIAVLSGSAEESDLIRWGMPNQRLIRLPNASSGRAAVCAGHVDGLALSAPTIRWMGTSATAALTEMAEPFEATPQIGPTQRALGGFAFRKEDRELRRRWNAQLAAFIGSEEHRRIQRAFAFTPGELPPSKSATLTSPTP